jgi:hypothetical protein
MKYVYDIEHEMPMRAPQHISESDSFKLFNEKMPKNWIIRQVTERDYGIDCYVEIVTDKGALTGHLVLCQLKSKESIPWNKSDKYTISDIKMATSNYWYNFQVPVFLFLTDIKAQEMYFLPVDQYIRQVYMEYEAQKGIKYVFDKKGVFDKESFLTLFNHEFHRERFESELLLFLSNVKHTGDFMSEHSGLDFHLPLEIIDVIYLETVHKNYKFLCDFFGINWEVEKFSDIRKRAFDRGGGVADFFELDATQLIKKLEPLTKLIGVKIREFASGEMAYWMFTNDQLFNMMMEIEDDGSIPGYYFNF